ncbi:unnamed protein product [Rotaria sordida]|uniref:Uncharacterized protein n=1 Tax=Rotaria sordida TaxID=392033 RepID=A0A813PUP6_9BILA|nr:unnamed protein product [Rotaria sordida]CAF0756311.1 unnamed protein product [Rotaria sordida]CAF0781165.1 unnamed protein product [Rotaria sordida]CAF0800938.1 unnamed protein product [Rotaria sordida]CAF3531762.1 unnamed protein product [Rotaria sordida]
MSNSSQFLIPINYDITKEVYPNEEVVRKRKYHMNGVLSAKEYHQLYIKPLTSETNFPSEVYADKLRRRAKFR